jgi:hypothetical protein
MEQNLISMFVTPLSSQNVIPIQLDIVICMVDLTGFKAYNCKPCLCTGARVRNVNCLPENEKKKNKRVFTYSVHSCSYSSVKLQVCVNTFVQSTRFYRKFRVRNVHEQCILGSK